MVAQILDVAAAFFAFIGAVLLAIQALSSDVERRLVNVEKALKRIAADGHTRGLPQYLGSEKDQKERTRTNWNMGWWGLSLLSLAYALQMQPFFR